MILLIGLYDFIRYVYTKFEYFLYVALLRSLLQATCGSKLFKFAITPYSQTYICIQCCIFQIFCWVFLLKLGSFSLHSTCLPCLVRAKALKSEQEKWHALPL